MTPEIDAATRDDMHHALGRPTDERVEPYRNRFVCGAGGKTAQRFEASGMWTLEVLINGGREAIYGVTDEGVALVMAEVRAARLAKLEDERAAGIRDWTVELRFGSERFTSTVRAKSRSGARYQLYLKLADAGWYHSYPDFMKASVSARVAHA
ncbi:hypothetical protein [Caulobacter sp. RL271]|uniref:Uncharacterized protein n=1 Tax=Caulobacter segnis TaxID=88688 RepID=A0ABY4ZXL1_9CAUL|nr:hypothetical protein [Caulobacter segnis]USQ97288.1 hypothetical protein MZV50_07015 [Caulobacter segnis]